MKRSGKDLTALLLLRGVAQRKLVFAASFLFIMCIAGAVTLTLAPVYESVTLLIGGQPDLDRSQADNRRMSNPGASIAAIAESSEVLRAAIAHRLAAMPNPRIQLRRDDSDAP